MARDHESVNSDDGPDPMDSAMEHHQRMLKVERSSEQLMTLTRGTDMLHSCNSNVPGASVL